MFFYYGETDDAFLIGGQVEPNETMMASAICHCRHLVNFCVKPNHQLNLTKIINDLIYHKPVKIPIYVFYILCKDLH